MMGKRVVVCLLVAASALVALVAAIAPGASLAAAEGGSVLVIHSYHAGDRWTDDVTAGIMSVLGESAQDDMDVQLEYMDTSRVHDHEYLARLLETYRYKFSERRFDVVVVSDDNAFAFLLEHRDELFPGTPVVFCGVNNFDPAMVAGHAGFTGVNEAVDVRQGIELALRLHPDTQLLAIVNDTTITGWRLHDELKAIEKEYKGRLSFLWLEAVDMAEVENTLRSLPRRTTVFYTRFLVDKSGNSYDYDESIRRVVDSSPGPVYGAWDFSLGYGIVGGLLTSGVEQGRAAADIALRIVNGEPADAIPVVMDSPNRYMFDYPVLEKWAIPLTRLPDHAIVINRPLTFYERYRGWILGGGSVVLGLVAVIVGLARANVRRRRAEEALRASNRELEGIRSSLEERVAHRTAALERKSVQLEAAAQVAREAAAIRDLSPLLDVAVRLVSDRMGFYHAGIFLLDEVAGSGTRYAVLRAASSEGGQRMLARGHRLQVGTTGIVGHVATSREPRIALDVGEDAVFFNNPDLPQTKSEIALPLIAYGEVLGVLDVQSLEREAFGAEDVAVLQTLADQVALAIDNARLLGEAEDRLREITLLARGQSAAGWREFLADRGALRYTYDGVAVVPARMRSASGDHAREPGYLPGGASQLEVPLRMQDEEIGRLQVELDGRPASAEEKELVGAVATRLSLALERARLFQEIQRRAASDRLVGEVAARVRETLDIRTVLETAADELYQQLGLEKVTIYLAGEEAAPDGGVASTSLDAE